eukprot:352715-Chlamydomonas_euryale.AAC.5
MPLSEVQTRGGGGGGAAEGLPLGGAPGPLAWFRGWAGVASGSTGGHAQGNGGFVDARSTPRATSMGGASSPTARAPSFRPITSDGARMTGTGHASQDSAGLPLTNSDEVPPIAGRRSAPTLGPLLSHGSSKEASS